MSASNINWNPSTKDLRVFAALLIPFCGLVAYWLSARGYGPEIYASVIGLGSVVGLIGLFTPRAIRWIYVGWMLAVTPISVVVTYVIMAIVFFGVFWPIAWMIKTRERDVLKLSFDKQASTYWEPRRQQTDPRRYFRQY